MSELVRSAAFQAAQNLSSRSLKLGRSHLSEVVAAALGYRTFAALGIEENDPDLDLHLGDAELIVLNVKMARQRCLELDPAMSSSTADAVVNAVVGAVRQAGHERIAVFRGVDDLYDSHIREAMVDAVESSEEAADATAGSNAQFSSSPSFPDATPEVGDLWVARSSWSIESSGVWHGAYDPEGDRMFNGDTLNCFARLTYRKAGRAGLVFDEADVGAGANDDWRDQDHEAEASYWAEEAARRGPSFNRSNEDMKAACRKHKNRDGMADSERQQRAEMPDLSSAFSSAVQALEYARDYVTCALSMERYRVHSMSRARIEMRTLLPYAIHPLEGHNRFIVLGRDYKPLGMARKDEHVDYEAYPNLHVLVPAADLHRVTARAGCLPGWLYNDGAPPYEGRAEAKALLKQIEGLINLLRTMVVA
ncbi:MAG: hypothetical protein C0423_20275 [Methylibium sp.]|nr:hypothetical protein [Methylibium sp.]